MYLFTIKYQHSKKWRVDSARSAVGFVCRSACRFNNETIRVDSTKNVCVWLKKTTTKKKAKHACRFSTHVESTRMHVESTRMRVESTRMCVESTCMRLDSTRMRVQYL
jgi:hypothetical protein